MGEFFTNLFLWKKISQGSSARTFLPKRVRRVLSPEKAELLTYMMIKAAAKAPLATVHGYPVAGKTGTAQKVSKASRGYKKGAYISSFAGFIPAQNPEFVIYIAVDEPKKYYYGSQVAAPVFAEVASFAVRQKGLRPLLLGGTENISSVVRKVAHSKKLKSVLQNTQKGFMPNLKGLSLRQAVSRLQGSSVKIRMKGSGWVTKTIPASGKELSSSQAVQLYLGL